MEAIRSQGHMSFLSKVLPVTAIVIVDWSDQNGHRLAYFPGETNLDHGKESGNNSYLKNDEGLKDFEKKLKHNDNYDLARTFNGTAVAVTDRQSEYNSNDEEMQDMVHSRFDTITSNETEPSSSSSSLSSLLLNSVQKHAPTVTNDSQDLRDVVQGLGDNNRTVDPYDSKTIEKDAPFPQDKLILREEEELFSSELSNEQKKLPQEFYEEWQNEFEGPGSASASGSNSDSEAEVNEWYDKGSNEVASPHLVYVLRPLDLLNDLAVNDIAAQRTSSGLVVPRDVELINVSQILRAAEQFSKIHIQELNNSK